MRPCILGGAILFPRGELDLELGKILLSLFKNTEVPTEHKPSSGISMGLNFHEG